MWIYCSSSISYVNDIFLSEYFPTIIALPSADANYKYYEKSYPIYRTMKTAGDYDYSGIFYFTLSNGFI